MIIMHLMTYLESWSRFLNLNVHFIGVILNDSFDLGKLENRVDFLTQKLESEFEDLVKGKQVNQYSIIIYGIIHVTNIDYFRAI